LNPASKRKRRIDLTAPLSVSFSGCGLWKTDLTPLRAILTLEPEPSVISAPSAKNKLSASVQGMFALTGFSKMSWSVFWCLLFSSIYIVSLYDTIIN
jgi:hypothetical protein